MTAFPIFERFRVEHYGLYPGRDGHEGLDVAFAPGLTLVLGANGLGKTTLITLLYRMCTGPFDIPGLDRGRELGTRRPEARALSRNEQRAFAARVADGAVNATAELEMKLSDRVFKVRRSVATLSLLSLEIDGEQLSGAETAFQDAIVQAAGLSSFGDWILLLRHLTFYFEDRRALVWDPSAQRQILRLLFLPADTSNEWSLREREVLELDSRMRNLQAALFREEVVLERTEVAIGVAADLRDEISLRQRLLETDLLQLDQLNSELASLDASRQLARLNALRAELDRESAFRTLEQLELRSIASLFPSADQTAAYLLSKLFSDGVCLACGQHAQAAASDLKARVAEGRCAVCATPLDSAAAPPRLTPRAISKANTDLEKASERLEATARERAQVEGAFAAVIERVQELNTSTARLNSEIDELVRRLPPEDADVHKQRSELTMLRSRLEIMKAELDKLRSAFGRFMTRVNRSIVARRTDVQSAFLEYAEGFLLEDCKLTWAPQRTTIGQTGRQIEYPGFELDLGGASFPSPVRRTGPDQVSESQREFIDLAFRMALMQVAAAHGVGTLVVDAPESSLDAVFVTRAADVMALFANPDRGNRLLITSNLVEGNLIPELLRRAGVTSPTDERVVDLLEIAAPTAATRELRSEYEDVRDSLFDDPRGSRG